MTGDVDRCQRIPTSRLHRFRRNANDLGKFLRNAISRVTGRKNNNTAPWPRNGKRFAYYIIAVHVIINVGSTYSNISTAKWKQNLISFCRCDPPNRHRRRKIAFWFSKLEARYNECRVCDHLYAGTHYCNTMSSKYWFSNGRRIC